MGLEFVATILVIVVFLQALHNTWLIYNQKRLAEECDELHQTMYLVATGKIKLKTEDFTNEGE